VITVSFGAYVIKEGSDGLRERKITHKCHHLAVGVPVGSVYAISKPLLLAQVAELDRASQRLLWVIERFS